MLVRIYWEYMYIHTQLYMYTAFATSATLPLLPSSTVHHEGIEGTAPKAPQIIDATKIPCAAFGACEASDQKERIHVFMKTTAP